jgi:transketolase
VTDNNSLQERAINTIRFLSADAVQKANSGHPGMPMGAAAIAYTLWTRHLRFNPENPDWPNRDRFILSGGHGSMLLYSLLYLTGYSVTLDDIKNFRQLGSITPGHPESTCTPGVEVTTGPLGQGLANSVGMAIAEKHLAAEFNTEKYNVIDHYTYAIVTDGDLMEGISYEASSLAGHLQLSKLILLYDDNRISIDGSTDLAFTEDRAKRYEAQGWHVQIVSDGNNVDAIDAAITNAKKNPAPSIILCHTHIGYGLPTKQDSAASHGSPAGEEELKGAKEKVGWPVEPWFFVPDDVLAFYRNVGKHGKELEDQWKLLEDEYAKAHPEKASELKRRFTKKLPKDWESRLATFDPDSKGIATRSASGKVINSIAKYVPELMGGSADLTGSNKTWIDGSVDFQANTPLGRNVHFGVREHSMGAITNGMAAHGGIIPYSGTFLIFSDYMRPAIRLSALSEHHSIWVFTHDSIGLGEDGPTHQPIEQLAALRAIPNLVVIRPSDANEVSEAWRYAIKHVSGPALIALTRQNIPILDRKEYASAKNLERGAYVLKDFGDGPIELVLMASGSEVNLIVKTAKTLNKDGVNVRVVSFPSWELFELQDESYREKVLPPDVKYRLAVEAGVDMGWKKYVGDTGEIVCINRFGASAPAEDLFKKFGFTVENISKRAKEILGK